MKTVFVSNNFFFPENLPFMTSRGIILYSRSDRGRHIIIQRMRFAWWISKATNIHSEYVRFIFHCNSGWTCAP